MAVETKAPTHAAPTSETLRIDFLFLDLTTCTGSEACTDGCGDQIACRVWVHRGREYTEPPVAMIVDAILGHVYGGAPAPGASGPEPYELPENLARFFSATTGSGKSKQSACCSSSEQESCCEAEAKADCCGAETEGGCGCR